MEMQAWTSLYHAMHATEERRPFSRVTLRRIAGFARPHQAKLTVFLLLSVVGAVLAVATPVLAGRVVDVIVGGGAADAVVRLALLIAAIAVAEAVVVNLTRWYSARIGEGLILDLRDTVFTHVQRMPVGVFTPDPNGGARQPAQQRRDPGPAGVQRCSPASWGTSSRSRWPWL